MEARVGFCGVICRGRNDERARRGQKQKGYSEQQLRREEEVGGDGTRWLDKAGK